MTPSRLTGAQVHQDLTQLHAWTLHSDPDCIEKNWQFDSFSTAVAFFDKVAALAEQHNHHPECLSVYRRIRIRLSTHDAGGLTALDFGLAKAIDLLITQEFPNAVQTAAST